MNNASTILMLLRFGFSLAFVFGMIWFAARIAKKQGGLRPRGAGSSPRIEVLDRQAITRHASVAVISLDGRAVLLGVTDQTVTLLGDAPELDTPSSGDTSIPEPTELEPAEISSGPLDLTEMDLSDLDLHTVSQSTTNKDASRRTGSQTDTRPLSPRMNFLDALRERSVRR